MKQALLFFLIALFVLQCKEKEPIYIGENNTAVNLIDTFSINLSTVYIDSLPTSNSERLLVGRLPNIGMGEVTVSSYFQISLNDKVASSDLLLTSSTPVYDSLVLILNHLYTYGDTTSTFPLSVNRVNEVMNYINGAPALYNSSYFSYDQTSLATQQLDFKNTNELDIKLSDQLGNELFSLARDNDYRIADNGALKDYLRGFVLLPPSSAKSIYGFDVNPIVRLYYHDMEDPSELHQYDFSTKSTDFHSNRIYNDRTGTAISSLNEPYKEIASSSTSNDAYLLTGVELFPKIQFPTLNDIKAAYPKSAINKAELIIHPKKGTYDQKYYPPGRLVLYNTNATNFPISLIAYSLTAYAEIITPQVDWESQDLTYYTFEVTDFVTNKLNNTDDDAALMLASLRAESANRVERLVLSNNNYDIKLRIYLTIF